MKVTSVPSGRVWFTWSKIQTSIWSPLKHVLSFSYNDYNRDCKYLTVSLSSVFPSSVSVRVEMAVDKRWLAWWSCTGGCVSRYKYLAEHFFFFFFNIPQQQWARQASRPDRPCGSPHPLPPQTACDVYSAAGVPGLWSGVVAGTQGSVLGRGDLVVGLSTWDSGRPHWKEGLGLRH